MTWAFIQLHFYSTSLLLFLVLKIPNIVGFFCLLTIIELIFSWEKMPVFCRGYMGVIFPCVLLHIYLHSVHFPILLLCGNSRLFFCTSFSHLLSLQWISHPEQIFHLTAHLLFHIFMCCMCAQGSGREVHRK